MRADTPPSTPTAPRATDAAGRVGCLLMDRENSSASGWSHVLHSHDDVEALDTFRRRVGAPPSALQRNARRPHLDIKGRPRQRALALDGRGVWVLGSSLSLMREYRALRAALAARPGGEVERG